MCISGTCFVSSKVICVCVYSCQKHSWLARRRLRYCSSISRGWRSASWTSILRYSRSLHLGLRADLTLTLSHVVCCHTNRWCRCSSSMMPAVNSWPWPVILVAMGRCHIVDLTLRVLCDWVRLTGVVRVSDRCVTGVTFDHSFPFLSSPAALSGLCDRRFSCSGTGLCRKKIICSLFILTLFTTKEMLAGYYIRFY